MLPTPHRATGRLFAALAVLGGLNAAPAAAAPGDKAAGKQLAQRWCAQCHVVTTDQKQAQSDAPTFPAIARRALDPSAEWIAFELLAPHPLMPEVSVSKTQAEDLSAYFKSLERAAD